jgi:RimJ/RimL family protein N-acetyltransferase
MYTVYTGERVRLRPFKNYDEHRRTANAALARPNDHWGPFHISDQERREKFEPAGMLDPGKYSHFAVERLDTGECVGWEEHGPLQPGWVETWLGTEILRQHWHLGFGLEAKQLMLCYLFENFPLETVRADTCGHHLRAQRGLEACGMRYLGCLRGAHYAHGVRYDIPQYQILREEWEALAYWQKVKRGN